MFSNSDSFFKPRKLSDTSIESTQVANALYDFITFLAVVQRLRIEVLPITWQAARLPIGIGATGQVNEALISLHTSFAFKCVSERQKERVATESIIQTLLNEIVVLGHESIQSHPNIVQLQGICWDVASDDEGNDKIWPVLVFEKAQYGDLYNFATLPIGKELCFAERLKICMDIGTAIWDMHFHKIVHGDVKPQNILIYKEGGDFTARVTDFAYSTRFVNENDLIHVPKTEPWNAPEHHDGQFTQAQAQKMDVFSFGMLCTWVMFEKYLSKDTPLPHEARWAERYFQSEEGKHLSLRILKDLKQAGRLAIVAQQLVMAEKHLDDGKKQALQEFLSVSLAMNPSERASSEQSFSRLILHRTRPLALEPGTNHFQILDCSFAIVLSVEPLYESDYRVRKYVRRCLENRMTAHDTDSSLQLADQNDAFQLAFCYQVGIGGVRDESRSLRMLHQSQRTKQELMEMIDRIESLDRDRRVYRGTAYANLLSLGHIEKIDMANQYRSSNRLEEAEAEIRREIQDLEHCIGKESRVWVYQTQMLSKLCIAQERWKETEELQMQLLRVRKRVFGEEHPATLTSMGNLAWTYSAQAQWREAKEMEMQVVEIRKRVLGEEHPDTLISMRNLASTYYDHKQWAKAEELEMIVLKIEKRVFGEEHGRTLTAMGNLAATYKSQRRWKEAEELETQVTKIFKRTHGVEHPNTLISMANLATTYRNQARWTDAEELDVQVIEISTRVLGLGHPDTLRCKSGLARTYNGQGRWKEAHKIQEQVITTANTILGAEHVSSIFSLDELASSFRCQGWWEKAEKLDIQKLQISKRVFGDEHSITMEKMCELALIFWNQGRWKEAEELESQVLETRKRVLGEEHQDTLTSKTRLAVTYRYQGRWKEAEDLKLQVIEVNKRVLGLEHVSTIASMHSLALMYRTQGRVEEAFSLIRESPRLQQKILSDEYARTELPRKTVYEWEMMKLKMKAKQGWKNWRETFQNLVR